MCLRYRVVPGCHFSVTGQTLLKNQLKSVSHLNSHLIVPEMVHSYKVHKLIKDFIVNVNEFLLKNLKAVEVKIFKGNVFLGINS